MIEGESGLLTGNCQTTAMGILPHTSVEAALRLALALDIPFWPQLPRLSFWEDMYVQASEHFPGIIPQPEAGRLDFNPEAFYAELPAYVEHWEDLDYFRLSPAYAQVYHAFLQQELDNYPAIRGQSIGPVSFGLKITDENLVPIIYHDEVRAVLFDFFARKIQAQYADLARLNPRAFVWIDEPGLDLIFKAFTGYTAEAARIDYRNFLELVPAPRGVHLCANPDWAFLLELGLDVLSVDALQWGYIFTRYTDLVREFLNRGGIISWGITPTLTEEMAEYSVDALADKLEDLWDYLAQHGIPKEQVVRQAWLAPARCCLINTDGGRTVEAAFSWLRELSARLRDKYNLT